MPAQVGPQGPGTIPQIAAFGGIDPRAKATPRGAGTYGVKVAPDPKFPLPETESKAEPGGVPAGGSTTLSRRAPTGLPRV